MQNQTEFTSSTSSKESNNLATRPSQRIRIHRAGGYERLEMESFQVPAAAPTEVVIQTEAIGVNYADCLVRWGLYDSAKYYVGWPITPGFEFSGRITQLGAQVTDLKVGDWVFGITRFGAYATHVVAPRSQVFPIPQSLNPIEAGGFPAVFMTAYHALFQHFRIRPGMKILVHSAAGGCGTALLQIGKIAGCEMVGVVGSSHKVETAKSFGADHVIDKSSEDLWKQAKSFAPDGYDVVLDANGYTTLKQSYRHLAPCGKLVVYGSHALLPRQGGRVNYLALAYNFLKTPKFNPLHMISRNRSLITFNVSYLFSKADLIEEGMTDLVQWLKQGKLKGPPVKTFPFSEAAKAHAAIESGQTVGKLVLTHS